MERSKTLSYVMQAFLSARAEAKKSLWKPNDEIHRWTVVAIHWHRIGRLLDRDEWDLFVRRIEG